MPVVTEALRKQFEDANLIINIQITGAVGKTVADLETLIGTMRASGATDKAIREVLLSDLNSGGRIFGAFRNQFKSIGEFAVGRLSQYGSYYEMVTAGVKEFKWQSAGKNICPDCKARHGQTGSWEEFEMMGLPKSGFSVCGGYCNCDLVTTGNWVKDPIKVDKI
jgi:hypothetical protein